MGVYFRFTLSFRDVEEMPAERGIDVSYETVRCWTMKFGRSFAQNLRLRGTSPTGRRHLDEVVVKIGGKRIWLWRAVRRVTEFNVTPQLIERWMERAVIVDQHNYGYDGYGYDGGYG